MVVVDCISKDKLYHRYFYLAKIIPDIFGPCRFVFEKQLYMNKFIGKYVVATNLDSEKLATIEGKDLILYLQNKNLTIQKSVEIYNSDWIFRPGFMLFPCDRTCCLGDGSVFSYNKYYTTDDIAAFKKYRTIFKKIRYANKCAAKYSKINKEKK